jgi:hypothetical protein
MRDPARGNPLIAEQFASLMSRSNQTTARFVDNIAYKLSKRTKTFADATQGNVEGTP